MLSKNIFKDFHWAHEFHHSIDSNAPAIFPSKDGEKTTIKKKKADVQKDFFFFFSFSSFSFKRGMKKVFNFPRFFGLPLLP